MFNNRRKLKCRFCSCGVKEVSYLNTEILEKYISGYNRILPRRLTGLCAYHQRMMATNIKKGRIMGLLPFVNEV